MSNTNHTNFEGTGNDMSRGKGIDDGSATDTEGHGQQPGKPRIKVPEAELPTDTEGHAAKWRGIDDGSAADAEGHAGRRPGIDDESDDDAEGHIAKAGRSATTGSGAGKPRIKP